MKLKNFAKLFSSKQLYEIVDSKKPYNAILEFDDENFSERIKTYLNSQIVEIGSKYDSVLNYNGFQKIVSIIVIFVKI